MSDLAVDWGSRACAASSTRTLAVTGANGNIGSKIAHHFLSGSSSADGKKSGLWHLKLIDDYNGFCKASDRTASVALSKTPLCRERWRCLRRHAQSQTRRVIMSIWTAADRSRALSNSSR